MMYEIFALDGLWLELRDGWFAPIFLIITAVAALMFLAKREFRGAIVFFGLAILASMFLFGSETMFAGRDATFTKPALDLSETIND